MARVSLDAELLFYGRGRELRSSFRDLHLLEFLGELGDVGQPPALELAALANTEMSGHL